MTGNEIRKLEPVPLWDYFKDITEIPRCSGNEGKIREYIRSKVEDEGCETKVDKAGNLIVKKKAKTGSEAYPIIFQSHMDMVCEKRGDVEHDFSKDPLRIRKEKGWITAEGTTLGADNGIGIALSLALISDKDIDHGDLEFLFTVSEETGLDGALALDPSHVEGRTLINLDSEEFGTFIIGCAGSGDSEIKLPLEFTDDVEGKSIEIYVKGLKGGHSGVDIHKGRANAIKVLGRLIWTLKTKGNGKIYLQDIKGGNRRNAIPSESKAMLQTSLSLKKVSEILKDCFNDILDEYSSTEEGMECEVKEIDEEDKKLLTEESTNHIIDLIHSLPDGVLVMSPDVPGLVRTSTNLATVSIDQEHLDMALKTRSSLQSELQLIRDRIRVISENFNAMVEEDEAYPGWEPDTDSEVLKLCTRVYKKLYDKEPKVEALHAGLETGIIGKKFEDMDMISLGADLKNPHSTSERVHIDSVNKLYDFIVKLLETVASG